MKHIASLLFFLITEHWILSTAKAKSLGTFGHTFEIQEPDLLKEIESKLHHLEKDGALAKHNEALIKKAEKAIHTPPPVAGITKTTQQRIFYYDPSITIPYDLKDHQGRIFHKAGTKINPLQHRSLSSTLIFIDGSDEEQTSWVAATYLKENKSSKIILTSGSPFELMKKWDPLSGGQPIYFDQGGTLTKKLGIKHVPAVVVQEGLKLKVTEVVLEEKTK